MRARERESAGGGGRWGGRARQCPCYKGQRERREKTEKREKREKTEKREKREKREEREEREERERDSSIPLAPPDPFPSLRHDAAS